MPQSLPNTPITHTIWERLFGVDVRNLAVFRIAVALVLLWNVATRAVDLKSMYSDEGWLPIATVQEYYGDDNWRWSLHFLSGDVRYQAALLGLAGILGVLLLLGWKTRTATILSWLLLISLHTRAPILVTGGDALLSMFLLWGAFLPWGQVWSLDARGKPGPRQAVVTSVATAAIMVQMAIMYLFTGCSKMNEVWHSGRALENVFHFGMIARPLGLWLADARPLLVVGNYATLALELTAPLLLFCPWKTPQVRSATAIVLALLHVGIELTMRVVIFSWASLAGLLVFVPPGFWRRFHLSDPPPERTRKATATDHFKRLADATAVALFALMLFAAIAMARGEFRRQPLPIRRLTELLVMDQQWNMFARPEAGDYRFAAEVKLKNGAVLDAFSNREFSGNPTEDFAKLIQVWPSQRWMSVFVAILQRENLYFRERLAEYVYRKWKSEHEGEESQIAALHLQFVHRPRDQDGNPLKAVWTVLAEVNPRAKGHYVNGTKHGHWAIRHENGQVQAVGEYRAGLQHGEWRFYRSDGTLEGAGVYVNGEMHGPWRHYKEDGTLYAEGFYDHGKKHGLLRIHLEQGLREIFYEHDLVVSDTGEPSGGTLSAKR